MTKPVISDAEVSQFCKHVGVHPEPGAWSFSVMREALAAFLESRVPSRKGRPNVHNPHSEDDWFEDGFNACRDAIRAGVPK